MNLVQKTSLKNALKQQLKKKKTVQKKTSFIFTYNTQNLLIFNIIFVNEFYILKRFRGVQNLLAIAQLVSCRTTISLGIFRFEV